MSISCVALLIMLSILDYGIGMGPIGEYCKDCVLLLRMAPNTGEIGLTGVVWVPDFLAGSLLPVVWPKFLDVGLASWPYLAIFLWLFIYAFESTGFFFSAVAFSLKDAHRDIKVN